MFSFATAEILESNAFVKMGRIMHEWIDRQYSSKTSDQQTTPKKKTEKKEVKKDRNQRPSLNALTDKGFIIKITPIFRGYPLFFRVVDLNEHNKDSFHNQIFKTRVTMK